jgi:hypothetical protein
MASSTGADDKCQFDQAILPVASLGDVKAHASGDENPFWLSWSHRVKPPPTAKTDPLGTHHEEMKTALKPPPGAGNPMKQAISGAITNR